ncbi:MAG: hypothetical protein AAFW73_27235 [Bacteroidota bacterium]
MIQYHLDLQYRIAGYFTLEESLVGYNLERIEDLLGYEGGRLRQGADFYTFYSPNGVDGFVRAATTAFPGDRLLKSFLGQRINTRSKRQEDLQLLRRKRLIKVVPIEPHFKAIRKHFLRLVEAKKISSEELAILDDLLQQGRSPEGYVNFVKRAYPRNKGLIRQLEDNLAKIKPLYEPQLDELGYVINNHMDKLGSSINNRMYPMALNGSVRQWKLTKPVLGRCLCRITHYRDDVYQRL